MRAGAFLQPTRIAGLVLMTVLVLGAADAVSPQAGRAAEARPPLTDTCDANGYCDLTVEPHSGGTITSDPPGIDCGSDCSEPYFFNDALIEVTLSAKAHSGWRFESWNTSCVNEPQPGETTCRLVFSEDTTVRPTFVRVSYRLTVTVAGTGSGNVSGTGISCPGDCEQDYAVGTGVQLTAAPSGGSTLGGWSGNCSGTATTCNLTMSADRNVTATFTAPPKRTLKVSVTGTGKVTAPGIDCPTDCEEQYDSGTTVQLTATPGSGMTLTSWGGDCSGAATTCSLVMSSDKTVSATFAAVPPATHRLTVTVTGSGKVTGSDVDCPGDCTQDYAVGTAVSLSAAPAAGYTVQWSGDCAGAATTCSLTMNANKSVSATFVSSGGGGGGGGTTSYRLAVSIGGTGSGTVTATGINCPGDCVQEYAVGTSVTLNATPAANTSRTWGGDCSSAGSAASCTLAMTTGRSVTVTFSAVTVDPQSVPDVGQGKPDPLPEKVPAEVEQVIVKIDGTGRVTSSLGDRVVAGATATKPINCGTTGSGALSFDCYGEYRPGQALTLSAKPASGYVFKQWTGACAGSGPTCRVTTRDSRTTTAIFEQGGTGAAVAALLRPPNLRVRWQSSVGAGNLVLRGSTSLPANARVDMRRPSGGPLATLRLKLGGGSFRQTLALRQGALRGGAKLFPGGFTVALTGRSGGLKLPLQMQTISVPAPAEGVVRRAFKSRTENGKSVTKLPARSKEAWANFRFETQPLLRQKLAVRWYWPDGRVLGEVQKSNRPLISSYLRLDTGLDNGLWVAELRAGKRVVQRLSVRVG